MSGTFTATLVKPPANVFEEEVTFAAVAVEENAIPVRMTIQ